MDESLLKTSRNIAKLFPVAKDPHASVSSVMNFLNCRRSAYYHSYRRIVIKKARLSLEMGTIWHAALATWYSTKSTTRAKTEIRNVIKELVKDGFSSFNTPHEIEVATATQMGMLLGYTKAHKEDLKNWDWLDVEMEFEIPNIFGLGILFHGFIDGVIYIDKGPMKGLWIVEHKSTRDLNFFTLETVKDSFQALCYIWAYYTLTGDKPKGIIWNAVRKPSKRLKKNQTTEDFCQELKEDYVARPDFYFFREQPFIPLSTIMNWEEQFKRIMADVAICFNSPQNLSLWYKNTSMCRQYGGCEFAPLCQRGEKRSTLALYRSIDK
jgi:hypothetical protein